MALLDKLKIGGTVYDAWATKDQVGSASDSSSATTVFGKIKAVFEHAHNLAQFFGITSATSFTAATPWEIGNELVDIWHNITGEWPPSVTIIGASKSVYVNGRTQYSDPNENVMD